MTQNVYKYKIVMTYNVYKYESVMTQNVNKCYDSECIQI